ncbi:CBS domain-containing protein [Halosimplex amylolyticum]|uniref:CBS domain-containing protein n=1 Tax=Halosimplex amylolyticum TaxID=3396616 RepID=UPI003F55CA01
MQGQPIQGQPTPSPQYGVPQGQSQQSQQPMGSHGMPTSGGAPGAQSQQMQHASQPDAGGMQAGQQSARIPGAQAPRGRSLLRPVSVDDVVAEDVVTVEPDASVRTAVEKMRDRDVGSVVVVEDDKPVGVLTDRTVALALADDQNVAESAVEELIGRDLISVDASTDIFETLQLMRDEGIRRLPVVDDEGRLQGIVTLDDALVLLGSELDKLATTVQEQSPRL